MAGALFTLVSGHTIDIPAKTKECFFEDLHSEDKVSSTNSEALEHSGTKC